MSPHIPSTSGVDPVDTETGQEPLVSAAVRIARELPAARPVVGVLRGWGRADREQARALRWHLAQQEIRSTELSAVPEAGERHHVSPAGQRPIVHFLLHVGGSQRVQALRAAALWNLPLLAERPPVRALPGSPASTPDASPSSVSTSPARPSTSPSARQPSPACSPMPATHHSSWTTRRSAPPQTGPCASTSRRKECSRSGGDLRHATRSATALRAPLERLPARHRRHPRARRTSPSAL